MDRSTRAAVGAAVLAALVFGGCGGSRDTLPPTTAAEPAGQAFDQATEVTLTASEPATVHVTFDGTDPVRGAENTLSGDSPLVVPLPEGTTEVRFFSVDRSGNREREVKAEVYLVDTLAPEVTLVGDPPAPLAILASASIEWQSNEKGRFTVELGGDGEQGSGTLLEEGDVEAEEARTIAYPATALPEDQPLSIWIHADDWTGRVGSLEVPLARAAPFRVPLENVPGDVVVLPGGDRAYVARKFGLELDVFDVDPASPDYLMVRDTIDLGIRPWKVARTPDGLRLYVSNAVAPGTIAVVDAETGAVERRLSGMGIPGRVTISPGGTLGYFTDFDGGVRVLDTDPVSPNFHTEIDRIPVGEGVIAGALAVSPDGTRALLNWTGTAGHGTDLLDLDPLSPTYRQVVASPVVAVAAFAGDVVLSADGAFGYASSSDPACSLCRIDVATGVVDASAPLPEPQEGGVEVTVSGIAVVDFPWALALTGDDQHLLAVGPNGGALRILRTDTMEEIARVTVGAGATAVAITPDGARALVTRSGAAPELVVVPLR